MDTPTPLAHLRALSDDRGIFEHALHNRARREHGYCVDDVARALIVVVHNREQDRETAHLTETYLRFLEAAVDARGNVHNRMDEHGRWTDSALMGDWWGRLVWAAGTTAVHAPTAELRERALTVFHLCAQQRPRDLRTIAFAALGAGEVASVAPNDPSARNLLQQMIEAVPPTGDAEWPWPEPRLRYANAAVPHALLAAGSTLSNSAATHHALTLLAFLVTTETVADNLSLTGTNGRGPGETGPFFDQQPIEATALAEACAYAYEHTGDPLWLSGIDRAWRWFCGHNDSATPLVDHATGGGFDGLERTGRNENQGAESTLAALRSHQLARQYALLNRA